MSLRHELDRYLIVRRSLGYELGTTERVLRRFIDFAETEQAQFITTALFLRWQDVFGQAGRQTWAARFDMVRLFAQWLHGLDPAHEPPPRGLIPSRYRRVRPYIYSEVEIAAIINAAAELAIGLRNARPHLLDAVRPDRCHRPADQRGACPRHRRRRF